ncbi:DEKNAAC104444 [Brettanomyces naardenensis]|uniref:Glutathione S-transferase omega-like 2 n=1 Tax=Brettanomyces naardenensis TaxID=13370 RepID=A0A448YR11_BRENA|nr:DEKNAAC104444 [Brettanomyces naardenensis]
MPTDPKFDTQKWADDDGQFKRKPSSFRDVIAKGGKFAPEKGRYHLYVSYACPWAHRTLIVRALKGLTGIIGLSVVHWHLDSKGWRFATSNDEFPGATVDSVYGFKRLSELYFKAEPGYTGRFTVPVLWDTKLGTIVNNESAEIIRIFNKAFNEFLDPEHAKLNFYPEDLQEPIDELNSWIYDNINNGVYKAGFATKQEPYEREAKNVFAHLDKVEAILKDRHAKGEKYLLGNTLTEADIRLYTTIVRFDVVYVQHFKCNIGMIRFNYPHLHKWLRELYWNNDAFKSTTNFDHIKLHYTKSHPQINPFGITPVGPLPNILP